VVYGADGTFLRNGRPDESLGRPSDLRPTAAGQAIATPNDLLMVEDGRVNRKFLGGGGRTFENVEYLPLLHLNSEWEQAREIGRLRMTPRSAADGRLVQVAFLPEPHWALLPDGSVVVADSTTWELRILGSHLGQPDRRLVREIPPMPVTGAMRQAEVERRAALPGGGAGGGMVTFGGTEEDRQRALQQAAEQRLRDGLAFHPERQVIREMLTDPEGRIWVARAVSDVDPGAPGPVDVISPEGRYLGTIESFTLPDAFGPDGLAAWVGTGEFEVPIIEVRRVRLGG